MNINWKVRFRNKTWLITFLSAIIALLYQLLALFGITPTFSQDAVITFCMMGIDVLVLLGVIIDPTTSGITDSATALTYTEPNKEKAPNE